MKKILAFLFAVSLFYFVGAQSVLASSLFNVEVRTYLDGSNMNQAASGLSNQARGSKVQFNATGISPEYSFAFYAVNDIVRDDLPQNYEFVVRSNMKITAFFRPNGSVTPANARHVVIFADNNGKIIADGIQYVADGGTATEPSVLPTKPNATHATPKWFTPQGESSLENITSSRVYLLQYVSTDNTEYTVNVTGGSVVEDAPFNYNDVVTLVPNVAPAEQVFSHWEDAEGNVLSTKANYKFTVMGNVSVQAVFAASPEFSGPVVNMSDALSIRSGFVTYKGQFDLPAGFTLVEYGFIFSRSSDVLTLDSLGATIVPSNVHNGQTGEFLRSFANDTFNSVRAYLIVKNASNLEQIVYSDNYYRNETILAAELIETVDFESSNGFTAGTTYNNTEINSQGPVNKKWNFYFGTPSTTGPITGAQSAQLRYYTATSSNHGYLEMDYTITNLSYITFDALNTSGNNVKVEYSLNGGVSYTNPQTFTLSTTSSNFKYDINQTGDVKVKFTLVPGTINSSRVTIDNVSFYRLGQPTPSQKVHEVKYTDDTTTIEYIQDSALISVPSKSKIGYTFNGWFTDIALTQSYNVSTPVVQSLQLYAKWTINQYTITFNSAGGSAVSPITQNYNTLVIAPANPTREGYSFSGWSQAVPSNMPAANITLTAQWTINQYTITFDSNGGSEVASKTQDFGSSVTAPAEPTLEGYTFSGWYYDNNTFANIVTFPVSMPVDGDVYYAKWVEASSTSYTVSFVIDISTPHTQPNQTVSEGGVASEPTSSLASYKWYSDSNRTTLFNFATPITGDTTIYGKIFMKDLIISEYIEGSSNNKAIEIYNGTGVTVDLSNYSVELYANGASTATSTLNLTGSLVHGDVYVIVNGAAGATLLSFADTTSAVANFNGDDAIALKKSGVVIDSFGTIGSDPGTSWTIGGDNTATVDNTVVRNTSVLSPTNPWSISQWTVYAIDNFTFIGSHTANVSNP